MFFNHNLEYDVRYNQYILTKVFILILIPYLNYLFKISQKLI